MRLKIISSGSIDDLLKSSESEVISRKSEKKNHHVDRRRFLKLLGLTGVGVSLSAIPNLLFAEKAYGQCYNYYGYTYCDPYQVFIYQQYQRQLQAQYGALLLASLNQLMLASRQLQVYQRTQGSITVVNDKYQSSSGPLALTVVDSGSLDQLEDYKVGTYSLPPRSYQTYEFYDGPRGQYPGNKRVTAFTRNDSRSSNLTVFA